MKLSYKIPALITLAIGLMAQPSLTITTAHAKDGCSNISIEGVSNLGVIEVAPGIFVLGALPAPATIAGIPGLLGSVATGARTTGAKAQGAQHLTLIHTFVSTDPARPGSFTTSDRAILAPAGTDPNTGVINDVLEIVGGTGVFANADGFLMNHAIIDLDTFTLAFDTHGRICADGL